MLALAACSGSDDGRGTGSGPGGPPAGPVEVGVVAVRQGDVPLTLELPGRTSASETAEVRPQVTGVIQARLFAEGSLVRRGQTLYRIDPSLYRAAVHQAAANLANAEANLVTQRLRAERLAPLARIEAVSRQEADDARAAAQQAAAVVEQTRAALRTARINLAFTTVPAPISGRIGRSLVTTGALATAGQAQALTNIQRLDPIFVDIQQSAAQLLDLRRQLAAGGAARTAAPVELVLEDGSVYPARGRLLFAEPQVDPETGTVTLRLTVPNRDGLLLPGMYVRARLSALLLRDVVLAPQAGISRDPRGAATAWVVGPDNRARLRSLTATRTVGSDWVVTGGLQPGERVIVEGLANVRPDAPVRPVPAGSPARTGPGPAARGAPAGGSAASGGGPAGAAGSGSPGGAGASGSSGTP